MMSYLNARDRTLTTPQDGFDNCDDIDCDVYRSTIGLKAGDERRELPR